MKPTEQYFLMVMFALLLFFKWKFKEPFQICTRDNQGTNDAFFVFTLSVHYSLCKAFQTAIVSFVNPLVVCHSRNNFYLYANTRILIREWISKMCIFHSTFSLEKHVPHLTNTGNLYKLEYYSCVDLPLKLQSTFGCCLVLRSGCYAAEGITVHFLSFSKYLFFHVDQCSRQPSCVSVMRLVAKTLVHFFLFCFCLW